MTRSTRHASKLFLAHAAKHAVFVLVGAALGWWAGAAALGAASAALVALTWHLARLSRLRAWLHAAEVGPVPDGEGPWPDAFARILRYRVSAQRDKDRRRTLRQEFREFTDALPDASFVLNADLEIVQHNETAARLLRPAVTDPIGQRITELVSNPRLAEIFVRKKFAEPVQITSVNDPDRTLSCQVTRYGRNEFLLIMRDVSERRRADKMRADFVANASHELRTPLTVIGGYLSGLEDDPTLDPGWHEPMAEMSRQVDRMCALVADLLTLNRLESSDMAPDTEVELPNLIRQACKEAAKLGDEVASIGWQCDNDVRLLGDKSALRSVIGNLLSNAVRCTPAGGTIKVTFSTDDGGGHLSVADTGIGIDSEDLERITERFYRADPGRSRHVGGTGLGLAIVKHALSIHEAHLTAKSAPGEGSLFTCHFPPSRVRIVSAPAGEAHAQI